MKVGAIEKSLDNSILDVLICGEAKQLLRTIEKGCFRDWFHVFMCWEVSHFRFGEATSKDV